MVNKAVGRASICGIAVVILSAIGLVSCGGGSSSPRSDSTQPANLSPTTNQQPPTTVGGDYQDRIRAASAALCDALPTEEITAKLESATGAVLGRPSFSGPIQLYNTPLNHGVITCSFDWDSSGPTFNIGCSTGATSFSIDLVTPSLLRPQEYVLMPVSTAQGLMTELKNSMLRQNQLEQNAGQSGGDLPQTDARGELLTIDTLHRVLPDGRVASAGPTSGGYGTCPDPFSALSGVLDLVQPVLLKQPKLTE